MRLESWFQTSSSSVGPQNSSQSRSHDVANAPQPRTTNTSRFFCTSTPQVISTTPVGRSPYRYGALSLATSVQAGASPPPGAYSSPKVTNGDARPEIQNVAWF